MKKKKTITSLNQPELYYQVLKECVENDLVSKADLFNKFKITQGNSIYPQLEELNFIKIEGSDTVKVSSQGFSTYLSISSQKQSAAQARKAIRFASWALFISAASFIANIIYNILK